MAKRIVFFDIDGTLITFGEKVMPESTKKALELLHQNDVLVYIATGRAYWYATFIKQYFDFDGFVCCNGQYCIDKEENVYYRKNIPLTTIMNFVEYVHETHEAVEFIDDKGRYVIDQSGARSWQETELITKEKLVTKQIMQLNIYNDVKFDKELMERFPACQIVRWTEAFADVYPKNGGKQMGIQKVLDHYEIALDDAVAIGDGGNDVSMLDYVPHSVAMGNAQEQVKAHARYVTADIEDDGIYKILKELEYI